MLFLAVLNFVDANIASHSDLDKMYHGRSGVGGVDFSGCIKDPETGLCCVDKKETVSSFEKEPILECTHKNIEHCYYTYVTQFTAVPEEICNEQFKKKCSITFL